MNKKEVMAIFRDVKDGQDVWLSDGIHTYYIGMYTGVVGPHGTSTSYYRYFGPSYNLYNVADELFGYEVSNIVRIDLPLGTRSAHYKN